MKNANAALKEAKNAKLAAKLPSEKKRATPGDLGKVKEAGPNSQKSNVLTPSTSKTYLKPGAM